MLRAGIRDDQSEGDTTEISDTNTVTSMEEMTEYEDDSKLGKKFRDHWGNVSQRISRIDKDNAKAIALLVLVAMVLLRLTTSTASERPPHHGGKYLRDSHDSSHHHRHAKREKHLHDDDDDTTTTTTTTKKNNNNNKSTNDSEDTSDPTANAANQAFSSSMSSTVAAPLNQQAMMGGGYLQQGGGLMLNPNQLGPGALFAQQGAGVFIQPGMLQQPQQGLMAQSALMQQQQQQMLQAQLEEQRQQQQQQEILLQEQQKQLEEAIRQQQEALQQQQATFLQQQQEMLQQAQALTAGQFMGQNMMGQNPMTMTMTNPNVLQQGTPQDGSSLLPQNSGGMADPSLMGQNSLVNPYTMSQNGMTASNMLIQGGTTVPGALPMSGPMNPSTILQGDGVMNANQLTPNQGGGPIVGSFSSGPAQLTNFKDSWDAYERSDVPIFWHIPKAGGSTVKDVIGSCHRHVMATEFGVTDGHDMDTTIAIVYPKAPGDASADRSPFVNVDTTTVAGIERAQQMGFADSGLADCVVTPFLYEANELFTPTAKGRLFSVFRHPVDRAVSMFYYIQVATWEPTYKPELQSWTLEQYASSDVVENNWMVRQLTNTLGGDLDDSHLQIAMEVVRSKFLVGIMNKLEESMTRFEKFFQWKYHVNPTNQEACRSRLTSGGSNSNSKNKKEKPKPGDPVWELLAAQNQYDIQLYDYIETLFAEQEAFVTGVPDEFRLIGATCCKCSPPTFPPEGFTCPQAILNQ